MDSITTDFVCDAEAVRPRGVARDRRGRIGLPASSAGRRSWTVEQKRAIVSESLGPGLTPTAVARKHGISTGQIYTWRQQLLSVLAPSSPPPQFASVELSASSASVVPDPVLVASSPTVPAGLIEIVLRDGVVVRVGADVDGRALRRVLGALCVL